MYGAGPGLLWSCPLAMWPVARPCVANAAAGGTRRHFWQSGTSGPHLASGLAQVHVALRRKSAKVAQADPTLRRGWHRSRWHSLASGTALRRTASHPAASWRGASRLRRARTPGASGCVAGACVADSPRRAAAASRCVASPSRGR